MVIQLIEQEWARNAACAQVDPEPFHPGKRTRKKDIAAAKELCRRCPVQAECLTSALDEEYGIWGGLDERERRHLRRERRLQPTEVEQPARITIQPDTHPWRDERNIRFWDDRRRFA